MKKRVIKISRGIFLSLTIMGMFWLSGCDSKTGISNPPPILQIVDGPAENDTLQVDYVSFAWKGSDDSFVFNYRLSTYDEDNALQEYVAWTSVGGTTETNFTDLDEGRYYFEVEGISADIGFRGTIGRNFMVDALQGSAIMFFKTKTELKKDSTATIGLRLEEIDSLRIARVTISFDPRIVQLVSVSNGDVTIKENLEQIILPDFSRSEVISEANTRGRVALYSAFLRSNNSQNYIGVPVSSGEIVKFQFKGVAFGTATLNLPLIELKNIQNNAINVTNPKPAKIEVQE